MADDFDFLPIDYHLFKSIVNRYIARHCGGDQRPPYFDIPADYPALQAVTDAFPLIKAEFEQLMADEVALPEYHEVDKGEAKISKVTSQKWSVCMLEILGHRPPSNRERCPDTCRVLEGVPNMIQAFFSILSPGKSVPEHEGPYLGYIRYHLALRVPQHNPPRIFVKGIPYTWREGEAVLFDDSWPHSVENNSTELRAVLIIDVMRPLPFMPRMLNQFFKWIARHTYGRKVAQKVVDFAKKQPPAAPATPARRAA